MTILSRLTPLGGQCKATPGQAQPANNLTAHEGMKELKLTKRMVNGNQHRSKILLKRYNQLRTSEGMQTHTVIKELRVTSASYYVGQCCKTKYSTTPSSSDVCITLNIIRRILCTVQYTQTNPQLLELYL